MPQRLREAVRAIPDFPEPGILFRDITPILASPALLRRAVDLLTDPFRDAGITHVAGIESRGFILGAMIADELGAGFVPVRKAGKLPAATISQAYDLEYGSDTVEIHEDALSGSDRVLVHDDVIATGGTAEATLKLIARTGATVAGCAFLVELAALGGTARLGLGLPITSVLTY